MDSWSGARNLKRLGFSVPTPPVPDNQSSSTTKDETKSVSSFNSAELRLLNPEWVRQNVRKPPRPKVPLLSSKEKCVAFLNSNKTDTSCGRMFLVDYDLSSSSKNSSPIKSGLNSDTASKENRSPCSQRSKRRKYFGHDFNSKNPPRLISVPVTTSKEKTPQVETKSEDKETAPSMKFRGSDWALLGPDSDRSLRDWESFLNETATSCGFVSKGTTAVLRIGYSPIIEHHFDVQFLNTHVATQMAEHFMDSNIVLAQERILDEVAENPPPSNVLKRQSENVKTHQLSSEHLSACSKSADELSDSTRPQKPSKVQESSEIIEDSTISDTPAPSFGNHAQASELCSLLESPHFMDSNIVLAQERVLDEVAENPPPSNVLKRQRENVKTYQLSSEHLSACSKSADELSNSARPQKPSKVQESSEMCSLLESPRSQLELPEPMTPAKTKCPLKIKSRSKSLAGTGRSCQASVTLPGSSPLSLTRSTRRSLSQATFKPPRQSKPKSEVVCKASSSQGSPSLPQSKFCHEVSSLAESLKPPPISSPESKELEKALDDTGNASQESTVLQRSSSRLSLIRSTRPNSAQGRFRPPRQSVTRSVADKLSSPAESSKPPLTLLPESQEQQEALAQTGNEQRSSLSGRSPLTLTPSAGHNSAQSKPGQSATRSISDELSSSVKTSTPMKPSPVISPESRLMEESLDDPGNESEVLEFVIDSNAADTVLDVALDQVKDFCSPQTACDLQTKRLSNHLVPEQMLAIPMSPSVDNRLLDSDLMDDSVSSSNQRYNMRQRKEVIKIQNNLSGSSDSEESDVEFNIQTLKSGTRSARKKVNVECESSGSDSDSLDEDVCVTTSQKGSKLWLKKMLPAPQSKPGPADELEGPENPEEEKCRKRKKKKDDVQHNWQSDDLNEVHRKEFGIPSAGDEVGTPIEYFDHFFDDDIMEMFVECTNAASMVKTNGLKSLNVTLEEMKKFLGIWIYMGVVKLKSMRDYWAADTRVPQVAEIMSFNRFQKIKSTFHVYDKTKVDCLDPTDRFRKVADFLNSIRMKCNQLDQEDILSVDESMVPYKGVFAGTLRQFIKTKPHRFGFKFFNLCGTSGMVYDFLPYAGQATKYNLTPEEQRLKLGVGADTVLTLVKSIDRPENAQVYFDNYFTGIPLIRILKNNYNIVAAGTIRANRTEGCPLKSDKDLQKLGRGSYDIKVTEDGVAVMKWFDNNFVHVASTVAGIHPLHEVNRWNKEIKLRSTVPMPRAIQLYNANMGGVDLHDMLVELYRLPTKSRRWYMALIGYMIDLCLTNSWLLYKRHAQGLLSEGKLSSKDISILPSKEFRIAVSKSLRGAPEPQKTKYKEQKIKTPRAYRPPDEVRFAGQHSPIFCPTQARCRVCKSGYTKVLCPVCQIALCFTAQRNCFKHYHEA